MRPWGALFTGAFQSLFYMTFCLVLKKTRFDDAMENFPIFGTASFISAIASIVFLPDKGALWGHKESGSMIGI
jgi:ammonia channel protein AmtB